jgi:cytochrome c oxidase subunit 3
MSSEHGYLAHHFDNLDQQREAGRFGMWAFLSSELMVFGGLFTGYVAYRVAYPLAFEEASRHLNLLIGGINTVVLLTSSLTMALAVHAAQTGQQRRLVNLLLVTALLGTAFMGLKTVEYLQDYRENLVPGLAFQPSEWHERGVNPQQVQLFLMCYYIMTGLHALHLIIGVILLLIVAYHARHGAYVPEHYAPVELTGLYWHFVDLVWLFLLPLLYLVGTRHSWH